MSLYASKVVNLPQSVLKFLVQQIDGDDCLREYQTAGGLLSNLEYAWLANGPRLEVLNTKNGDKIGAWIFGSVLKDLDSEVVCVGEVARPHGRPPLLVVAVDCALNGSTICVFDFITSKVVRAVQLVDKVTSLHVIDSGIEVLALPGPLRTFDGIVAIGTTQGNVFLLDICRQACDEALTASGLTEVRDELNSCLLSVITPRDMSNIEMHKEHAVRAGQHLAIYLNAIHDQSTPHFILKGPNGEDRLHVNKKEVVVSALHYCPQLGSLIVGYNFGAFQLYNLITMELIFTSPVCEEHIPISHFTIQEPADDPRAFCYIWAVYSDQFHATCLPLAVMYTCCYISKEYHEGYGYLYEDFQYCNVNYQMELGSVAALNKTKKKVRGGNCVRLNSILRSLKGGNADMAEDNSTLCFFSWNVTFVDATVETYAAVFDLNQWYKAQMPSQPDPDFEYASTFMIQLGVSDSIPRRALALDVQLSKNSIQQFVGTQRLEEHFCPDSLSFGLCCLRESDVAFLQNNGVQKALLNEIEAGGPLCLIEPTEIYQKIIKQGLVPLFIDVHGHPDSDVSFNHQREIILGTALEHQLVGWICKCASDWANGSFYVAGCSLDLLICWAFQRAQALKTHCDNFCVPLFDYSETRLDANTNTLLNNCVRQIKHICSFYCYVSKKLLMFVSNPELVEEQHSSLQMVCMHYEVLQWFLNVGLLPECPLTAYPRSDEFDRINAPYPAHVLNTFYNHRRAILRIANQNEFSSSQSVLFIDNLIEKECGGRLLQEQWEKDEGNGLYPPPSLQALLRTYLVNGTELCHRHSVIIYVLLDLAMTLDAERYQPVITNLIKFPAVFKVSPSIIKITQAFWQLDHEDYNSAMGLLLDPMILADDLKYWHHRVVLRTLLLHKEYNTALLYFQVRKPPIVDDEDIFTAITLYITNNMLDEAFYFEKHFTNRRDRNKFLLHLFRECNKNSKIRSIIYRTFTSKEETLFLKFLSDCKQEQTDDLIIYYHMLRLHFFEAFDYYDSMRANNLENRGLLGQDKAGFRDQIIHHMKSELPKVSRRVLDYCQAEKSNIWQAVDKPKPLSVFVHNLGENIEYKSSLIRAALAKSKQTYGVNTQRSFETEKTPFLRTPLVVYMAEKPARIVVNPRIVEVGEDGGETCGPPPAKRIKLSPRHPATPTMSTTIPAKLETPIVKRQSPNRSYGTEKFNIRTPQSILKVKKLIDDGSGRDLGFDDDMNSFEKLQYTPVTSLRNKGSQESRTPSVRFKGLMSSSENDSSSLSLVSSDIGEQQKEPLSEDAEEEDQFYSPEKMEDQNDLGEGEEEAETFSANHSNVEIVTTPTIGVPVLRVRSSILKLGLSSSETSVVNSSASSSNLTSPSQQSLQLDAELNNLQVVDDDDDDDQSAMIIDDSPHVSEVSVAISTELENAQPRSFSPKGRRSYKRSHSEMSQPTRSSPRLSQASSNVSKNSSRTSLTTSLSKSDSPNTSKIAKSESATTATAAETEEPSLPAEDVPPHSPRTLRKRKSLCRQVLEYNTFTSSRLNATLDSSTKTEEQTLEEEEEEEQQLEENQEQKETIVESSEIVLESKFKYADESEEKSQKISSVKKRVVSTTTMLPSEPIVWDSDLDSSGDFLNTFLSKSNSAFDSPSEDSEEENEESKKENRIDEEQRKDEEEQRRKEEEEQKRKEEEEKRLKEEVEQILRAQEEQRRREEEEQRRKEQEEQKLKEEVEQRLKAQEERRRREEEEQRRKVQEAQRLEEEEQQRRKDQEEQRRREEEEQGRKEQNDEEEDDDDEVELVISEDESILDEPVVEGQIKLTVLERASFAAPASIAMQENKDQDEAMDVDDDDDDDDDVYANLSGSEDEESPVYEDISKRDPEMNVFEISDDLSYNASTSIQKEITMEEESQYYDQSNALETVMEENICHISSSFGTLERNVIDDENSGDEEVHHERNENEKKQKTEEVIEISSSDDDDDDDDDDNVNNLTSGEDSSYSPSSDSPIPFEKNVYDSEEISIDSSSNSESDDGPGRERYPEIMKIDNAPAPAMTAAEKSEETVKQTVEEIEKTIDLTNNEQKAAEANQGDAILTPEKESVDSTIKEQNKTVEANQGNTTFITDKEIVYSTNKEQNKAEKVKQADVTLIAEKESVDSTNTEEIEISTNAKEIETPKLAKQSEDVLKTAKERVDTTDKKQKAETKQGDVTLIPEKQSVDSTITEEIENSTNAEEVETAKLSKQKTAEESVDLTTGKVTKNEDEEVGAAEVIKESDDVLNRKELENVMETTSEGESIQLSETLNESYKTVKEYSIKEKTEKLRTIIENIKNNTVARIIDEFDDSYEEIKKMGEAQGDEKMEVEDISKCVEAKAVETEKIERQDSVAKSEFTKKQENVETMKEDVPAASEEATKIEVVEDVTAKVTETKEIEVDKSAEDVLARSEEAKRTKIETVLSSDEGIKAENLQQQAEKRKIQSPEPAKTDTPTSVDKRRKAMARRKTKVVETANEPGKHIPEEFIRGEGVPGPSGLGALKTVDEEEETVEEDYLGCPTPHFLKRCTTRAVSADPESLKNFERDYLDCVTPDFVQKRTTRAASAEPQQPKDSPSSTKRQSKSKTPGLDPLDCETPAFLKRRTRASSVEPEELRSPKPGSKTPGVDFLATPEFLKRRVTRAYSAEKERLATPDMDDLGCPTPAFLKRRRVSNEEKKTTTTPPRTLRTRSASLDVDVGGGLSKRKSSSKLADSQLPLIVEESEGNLKVETKQKKARSTMDDYSSSRRLTRRQKELLEKSFGQAIDLEQINPIILLDKSAFKGQPDLEEKDVYETTPPSSPSSAKEPARRLRSASQVSDGSNVSETFTPAKKDSKNIKGKTPPSSGRVLRSRSLSNASSNASSVSNISRTSKTSTRRKVTSLELPEIKEEVDEPHPAKRKARSKK